MLPPSETPAPSTPAPETPARATYHHGDLREALLAAALALLAEAGPEACTLREIARRAGVNHRAAYRHFQDKRALFATLAERGWSALVREAREAVTGGGTSPEDRLVIVAQVYLRHATAHPALYDVMSGPRLNADGRHPELEACVMEGAALLDELLTLTTDTAPRAALRDASLALWAAMHGVSDQVNQGRIRVKPERLDVYTDTLLRPVVRGLVDALNG